jgi:hypothetical protein
MNLDAYERGMLAALIIYTMAVIAAWELAQWLWSLL